MPEHLEELPPWAIAAWQKAYERAQKQGNPLAALASWLVRQQETPVLQGEGLDVLIADRSLLIGPTGSQPIMRQANWFMSPVTPGLKLPIARVTKPAIVVDGLEIQPATEVQDKIVVERLRCEHCKDHQAKEGWRLQDQPGEPNAVVQCPTCRAYVWLNLVSK